MSSSAPADADVDAAIDVDAATPSQQVVGDPLDIFSDSYDPLLALYDPSHQGPYPDVKAADNVEALVARVKKEELQREAEKKKIGQAIPPPAAATADPLERRFGQLAPPPDRPPRPLKSRKNVLTFLERQTSGPFGRLRQCMLDRGRIRVWTRNAQQVRGHLVGFLVAFDKHWNMALVDVEETFTRRRRRKGVALAEEAEDDDDDDAAVDHRPAAVAATNVTFLGSADNRGGRKKRVERMGASQLEVVKTRRKSQVCRRHAPQLLLRGEHVVMVSVL